MEANESMKWEECGCLRSWCTRVFLSERMVWIFFFFFFYGGEWGATHRELGRGGGRTGGEKKKEKRGGASVRDGKRTRYIQISTDTTSPPPSPTQPCTPSPRGEKRERERTLRIQLWRRDHCQQALTREEMKRFEFYDCPLRFPYQHRLAASPPLSGAGSISWLNRLKQNAPAPRSHRSTLLSSGGAHPSVNTQTRTGPSERAVYRENPRTRSRSNPSSEWLEEDS